MQFSSFRISNAFLPAETIILSCFWVVFWPELPKNVVKSVWPVMTCKMMHLICYCFYWSTGQKTDFLAHYESFLCMLSYTLWVMPQNFVNWETLLRYSSVAGFITTGYVVVKFKVFLLIPHPWHGPMKLLYSPKSCSILFEIIRSSTNKTNTASKSFKILNFGSDVTPKFTVSVHFGVQFTSRKPKILLKTRISAKTAYDLHP